MRYEGVKHKMQDAVKNDMGGTPPLVAARVFRTRRFGAAAGARVDRVPV